MWGPFTPQNLFGGGGGGEHPMVRRIMKSILRLRPPNRKAPELWDPAKVLDLFQHEWPSELSLEQSIMKCAFLTAVCSAKRHSEICLFLCDDRHLKMCDDFVRITPHLLSKSDREGHLGSHITLKPF